MPNMIKRERERETERERERERKRGLVSRLETGIGVFQIWQIKLFFNRVYLRISSKQNHKMSVEKRHCAKTSIIAENSQDRMSFHKRH